jgi:ABC-2 type transport system permease protein
MNTVNKTFLRLVLLPSGIYRRMNVNVTQLKSILSIKLTMDDRRVGVMQQTRRRKKNKPVSYATIGTMLISGLLGLVYLMAFMVGQDMVTHLTFYFSLFFFMLSATLISDFTSVLIDVRDNYIILPKPVNDRTVILARLLHIFIHINRIVLPMALPGLVKIYIDYGFGGALVLMLMVFSVTLFAIFFINAIYILILKITTPQKFQAIINYVQIVFAILIYGSYQIFPRMITTLHLTDFDVAEKPGMIYYPVYWFAEGWQMLYTWQGSTKDIVAGVLGCLLPLASLFIVIKYLAPSFNNKLALINSSTGTESSVPTHKITERKTSSYAEMLSGIFTRGAAERMGFLFTWKMTSRSRDFKMKVYPSIGYLLVYVVIMFLNNKHLTLRDISDQQSAGKMIVISALYFTSLLLTMAINQIVYSDKYKASWFYYTMPLKKPGEVIMGAAKAAIFKFYIPIVVFITLAGLILIGPSVLPNIVLGLFNQLLIATILVYAGNKMFPFSMHQNTSVKTGSFLRNMMVLAISGLIAVGHYFIYDVLPGVALCALLSIIATWLLMGSVKNITWEAIASSYKED